MVWRTTLLMLFFGALVGALVALASTVMVGREERNRMQQHLAELMATVERTASIAAFARDEQLATEVARGLLLNDAVSRVVITEGNHVLAMLGDEDADTSGVMRLPVLTRPLNSPFAPEQQVGELRVWPAGSKIAQDAGAYSRFIAVILLVELMFVVLSVAWVVFNVFTRPVKKLSDDLHHLEIGKGAHVAVPNGHADDEIGRLAGDVNALITRMDRVLDAERDARAQFESSERKFRLIFEGAETGIFTVDSGGRLHDWNPWLAAKLRLPEREGHERNYLLGDLLGDTSSRLDTLMVRALSDQRPTSADFGVQQHDESNMLWLHVVLNPLPDGLLQGIANDVTERKRAEARALAMAERDALTGLLNRRGMEHRLNNAIDALHGHGLALMLLDLDGFKQVNDTFGHEAGDHVLNGVARQLESVVRRTDLVTRLGGDEFVIVLCALESADTARFIATKIVNMLARSIDVGNGQSAQIGASIGIAYTEDPATRPEALMRRADEAMYAAKRAGKSQYRFAS